MSHIKRKLDDYAPTDDEDDVSSDLVSVRMRKDQPNAVNSTSNNSLSPPNHPFYPRVSDAQCSTSTHPGSTRSLTRLQFFVRLISDGNSLVLHGSSDDTVQSIHEKIQSITGIPIIEQRLIYRGKQLQSEQTLSECSIQNDAGLQLVGRLRSTKHPQAWQVINEMVSLICRLCKGESTRGQSKNVKSRVMEFLTMTPRNDNEQAAGHLQIFTSSCAPEALVMLYMSPLKDNKDIADEAIRHFINSSKTVLPKSIHSQFAPILLEFCKLLSRAGHEDRLYNLCRSSLGSMVEYIGLGRGSKNGGESSKCLIAVQEIFPFISELAARLSSDLVSTMEYDLTVRQPLSDVKDFTAFLLALRTAIMEEQVGGPIEIPIREGVYNVMCYREETEYLHGIFVDLLEKMEQCLQKMEECLAVKEKVESESLRLGWCQYLAILKELNCISKLYGGAEELFWTKLSCRKDSVCFLIVRYAKRSDDHQWILEHKDVTNFKARRHLAMMILPEVKDEYEELHEMLIDRSQLLAESFEYIAHADLDALRGGLFMEFKNEEATGPGVLREWFFLVCQAIFNPQNALFVACPNDRRRFFPNPGKLSVL
ncbi:unnamed protein product [Ilex paraguariensis]|uniref:HECT-type E3 ubiquitin transferase n=1 Tax=Ilex paraguariensis TaxID=185542 RepID=A0ABC8UMM0_9AQUA